ncbi:hypothetical protein GpartN1_g1004.t1 [Galdieria partita]|uniref:Uncharacterized protein n=1 Tax=Galdieria partita TaxID=83374 RepID=A0A9C7PR46_9RHOD|nr:hypothetical protein GpartN1_g1004.t1 [Galdieria partita]
MSNRGNNVFFPLLTDIENNESSTISEQPSVLYDWEVSKKSADDSSHSHRKTNEQTCFTSLEDLLVFRLDEQTCVVCLKKNQSLGIKGKCYMKVLGGKVCLYGNTFEPDKSWIYLGASAWDPLLVVDSDDRQEDCFVEGTQPHRSKDKPLEEISWLEDVLREDAYLSPCVSWVESIQTCSPLKAIIAFRSYRHSNGARIETFVHSQDNNFEKLIEGLYLFRNRDIQRVAHFQVWNGWKELLMSIDSSFSLKENFRVFLVCGDRGVGKSTFMRTLCNRLLKFHRHVWLLDTDLGQSETMPPGMVSLVEIKSFFQSTPLTHEIYDSAMSYFIGVVTPRERPQIYREAIQRLALEMHVRASRTGGPCVINTHGWTTGLGLTILQFLFQLLHPTDVVQLEVKDSVSKLSEGWFDSCHLSNNNVRRWKLTRDPSTSTIGDSNRLSSSEKRHLQLLIYFCPEAVFFLSPPSSAVSQTVAYQIGNQFAQLPIYQVWLKDMQIYSIDGEVDIEHVDTLLLGFVVGLCWNDEQTNSLKDCEPLRCFGLGLVKAMEKDRTILYISTPVSESKLKQVNTLVVSRFIQLPPAAYLWTGPTEPQFVSWDGLSYASSEMRSRNNIPRRRFLNKKDNETMIK